MKFFNGRHSKAAAQEQKKRQENWLYHVCRLPDDLYVAHVHNVWCCPKCGTLWHLNGYTVNDEGDVDTASWTKEVSDEEIDHFLEQASE